MPRSSRYSPEVQERAVRLVQEHLAEHASQWAAITSIAGKLGCTAETLRRWVRQRERDAGQRPGLTTEEQQRLKVLERENRELRRANEILRKASVDSSGQRNSLASRSAGVSKSRVLRGRLFSLAAMASRSSWGSAPMLVPFGKY